MTLLVTGAAGFIGSHVAMALLERGEQVIGIDNLNDYYDPALKRARIERAQGMSMLPGFVIDSVPTAPVFLRYVQRTDW